MLVTEKRFLTQTNCAKICFAVRSAAENPARNNAEALIRRLQSQRSVPLRLETTAVFSDQPQAQLPSTRSVPFRSSIHSNHTEEKSQRVSGNRTEER